MVDIQEDFISVETPEAEETGLISLEKPGRTAVLNPEVIEESTKKFNYALGENSPGEEVIRDSLTTGNETFTRERLALEERSRNIQKKYELATEYLAKRQPGDVGEKDIVQFLQFTDDELNKNTTDPQTYYEKKFGDQLLIDTQVKEADSAYNKALDTNPSEANEMLKRGSKHIAIKESLSRLANEVTEEWNQSGIVRKAGNVALQFLPLYSDLVRRNATGDIDNENVLTGSNFDSIREDIYLSATVEEAALKAKQAVEDIKAYSLIDAVTFANQLVSFSESDRALDNLFNGIDIATIIPLATLSKGITSTVKATGGAFKKTKITAATGDVAKEALEKTIEKVNKAATNAEVPTYEYRLNQVKDEAASIFNPTTVFNDTGTFSAEYSRRLETQLTAQSSELLSSFITDPLNVQRVSGQALGAARREAERIFRVQYPQLNDAVNSIVPSNAADNLGNVEYVSVRLGNRATSELFDNELFARMAAKDIYNLSEYEVKQQGNKYFIEVKRAVDETADSVREALAFQTTGQTPATLANTFIPFLRSKDDKVARNLSDAMKVVTYGSSGMVNRIKSVASEVGNIPRADRRNLGRFLQIQRDADNPVTGLRGVFSRNLGEFEQQFQAAIGTRPTEAQAKAYFSYIQINDIDWTARNLSIYRDKTRKGLQLFDLELKGLKSKAPFVEGKVVDAINFDAKERTNIILWDPNPANIRVVPNNNQGRRAIAELEGSNPRIIQVSQNGEESIRGMPGIADVLPEGQFSYVVSLRDVKSSPLPFKQIPYRPGGHVEYPNGFFVRQPVIRRGTYGGDEQHVYYGDRNAYQFQTQAQAQRYGMAMERARQLRAAGDEAGLRAFLANNLPMSYQDFTGMFDPDRGGIFDLNTPFYYTPNGVRVADAHNLAEGRPNFVKKSDSSYNLYDEVNLKFATERGETLNTIVETGSDNAPYFALRQADLVDPFITMNNAAQTLMRGRFIDDLKIKAAEEFATEFADILDATDEQLRSPIAMLFDAPFKKGIQDKRRLAAAKNVRRSMKEFLVTKSDVDVAFEWFNQRVADSIYENVGPGRILNTWELARTKNPLTFARSVAFHAKLGILNPVQLFLQAQTLTHVTSLEGPVRAGKSMIAARISDMTAINPNKVIHDDLAKKAASVGWKPREFLEANEGLAKSGFGRVGGEVAVLDDLQGPNISGGALDAAKEWSTLFFTKGERAVRKTAYFAAYDRWRTANPRLAFDNAAQAEVLARADLLSVNMSRASNASWQTGVISIPTQFFAYQARLMEQFWGARLSPAEKLRAFTGYSLTYGVPVGGLGFATGGVGWPIHEEISKGLLERGIDPDQNAIASVVEKGLIQTLWRVIGEEDHNFAERYGPGGLSFLKDLVKGDKGTFETLAGVAGSVWGDALLKMSPIAYDLVALASDSDDHWPIAQQNFTEAMSVVSTFNNAHKAYIALNWGKYISKNGVVMQDNVNGWDAMFTALTGTMPQSHSDFWLMVELERESKAAKREIKKQVLKWYRLGHRAETVEERDKHYNMGRTIMLGGDFDAFERQALTMESYEGQESAILDMERRFALDSPEKYQAYINRRNKREQE